MAARKPPRLGSVEIHAGFYADVRPRAGRYAFSFADWRILTGPLVYAWVDRLTVNYVGMSAHGFTRILAPRHHAIRRYPDIPLLTPRQGMRLYVWPMKDAASAVAFERQLIADYRPWLNKAGRKPDPPSSDEPPNPNEPPLAAARRRLEALGV
jgi:hypothetical protein